MSSASGLITVGEVFDGTRVVAESGVDARFEYFEGDRDGQRVLLAVPRGECSELAIDERLQALKAVAALRDVGAPYARLRPRAGVSVLVAKWFDGASWPSAGEVSDRRHAMSLIGRVVDTVAAVHIHRIAHGGISRAALRLTASGDVALRLPGVADLVRPVGNETDPWAPPEGCYSHIEASSSDVFSIGAIAFELLTGAAVVEPWDRRNWRAIGRGRGARPSVAGADVGMASDLAQVLDRALAPTGSRPTNALVFRALLRSIVATSPSRSRSGSLPTVGEPSGSRRRGLAIPRWLTSRWAAAGLVFAVAAAAAAAIALRPAPRYTAACANQDDCHTALTCRGALCQADGMQLVPAGSFAAGSQPGHVRWHHDAAFEARISRPYYVASTEVSQGQWRELMDSSPSWFDNCGPDCPVDSVSWFESLAYANAASQRDGLTPCYQLNGCTGVLGAGCPELGVSERGNHGCRGDYRCENVQFFGVECEGYRLPTEIEWEFAARAGTTATHYAGNMTLTPDNVNSELETLSEIAFVSINAQVDYAPAWPCRLTWQLQAEDSEPETDAAALCGPHPVGQLEPNALGLYDMIGNVSEWTYDAWRPNPIALPGTNCDGHIGPDGTPVCLIRDVVDHWVDAPGGARTVRGGAWFHGPGEARSAARSSLRGQMRYLDVGFRLVRTAMPPPR